MSCLYALWSCHHVRWVRCARASRATVCRQEALPFAAVASDAQALAMPGLSSRGAALRRGVGRGGSCAWSERPCSSCCAQTQLRALTPEAPRKFASQPSHLSIRPSSKKPRMIYYGVASAAGTRRASGYAHAAAVASACAALAALIKSMYIGIILEVLFMCVRSLSICPCNVGCPRARRVTCHWDQSRSSQHYLAGYNLCYICNCCPRL